MTYDEIRHLLLSKPESQEYFPFYPDVPVFKIKGKVFAILSSQKGECFVNLKCDPEQSEVLRMMFDAITPAYHMNKRHWNSVHLDKDFPGFECSRLIDHSYGLVVKELKVAQRKSLELGYGHQVIYGNADG
jgi:predicted DNA-binding protein (MmcQ/YjbR family)